MADFTALAAQYVGADSEPEMKELAARAAQGIQESRANRMVVLGWVESVRPWMESAQDDDFDLISRAKALRFLADTLKELPNDSLKAPQVELLVGFFKVQLGLNEKVGVLEAMTALQELSNQLRCKPEDRVGIIEAITQLGDDFSRQPATTRLKAYELLDKFIHEEAVRLGLREKYGENYSYVTDLVELCHLEKDPRNLILWFKFLQEILRRYFPPMEVRKKVFESFSAFFPISLRRDTNTGPVTVAELKEGLRDCFASDGTLSSLVFPFLLAKLDQPDSLTVAVKVDVLKTIQACAESYEDSENNLVPFLPQIWSSLKYEVRNGEVEETIVATLDVFRAITKQLDEPASQNTQVNHRKDFCALIFNDVRDDLSNSTYCRSAGRILAAILGANLNVFIAEAPRIINALEKTLDVKSIDRSIDILGAMNSILTLRSVLLENVADSGVEIQDVLQKESVDRIAGLFNSVYDPVLKEHGAARDLSEPQLKCLQAVIDGLALLVSQKRLDAHGEAFLVCGPDICEQVCLELALFAFSSTSIGTQSSASDATLGTASVPALCRVVMHHHRGFGRLVDTVLKHLRSEDWQTSTAEGPERLRSLRIMVSRLAFIGCSQIPTNIQSASGEQQYSPLKHFNTFNSLFIHQIREFLENKGDPRASAIAAFGINAAVANFQDACQSGIPLDHQPLASRMELVFAKHGLDDWGLGVDQQPVPTSTDVGEVHLAYLRTGYATVRLLYQTVVKKLPHLQEGGKLQIGLNLPASQDSDSQDLFLNQLSSIACNIVQQLSAGMQMELKVAKEAFRLFVTESNVSSTPRLSQHDGGRLSILSLGILQGLWPAAVADLTRDGSLPQLLTSLARYDFGDNAQPRVLRIFSSIQTVLANKYKELQPLSDSYFINFWENFLQTNVPDKDRTVCREIIDAALAVAAGFAARRQNAVASLAPTFLRLLEGGDPKPADERTSVGSEGQEEWSLGEYMARGMAIFFQDQGPLSVENHAVIRPLHKQWAYVTFIKPALAAALSVDGPSSDRHELVKNSRIAVLEMLRHVEPTVYDSDIEDVVRVLLISIPVLSSTATYDLLTALRSLHKILETAPEALEGHLKTVLEICARVYDQLAGVPGREGGPNVSAVRLATVQILASVPATVQIVALLPHSRPVQRTLILASGDDSREVRRAAIAARKKWARVR